MSIRALMFGWEFPPHAAGGLGIVSRSLAHTLRDSGVEVLFALPRRQTVDSDLHFLFGDVRFDSAQQYGGYGTSILFDEYDGMYREEGMFGDFIGRLFAYAKWARSMAGRISFDVIHAHDWLTYLAGIAAKEATGKPLIVHVHNTIFDRGLGQASAIERAIEKEGITKADGVIAVSEYTKNTIVKNYGIAPSKIRVIHNAADAALSEASNTLAQLKDKGFSIVLYHGRITIQKGVEYFIRAAQRVLEHTKNVVFIVSGDGDMRQGIVEMVAAYGIADNFLFVTDAWGADRDRLYRAADVVVMPSVSEPFGIVPLEALLQGTPVIVSKQSGVAEVLSNALKVDFWDTDEMANKMLSVIAYDVLRGELIRRGREDARQITWHEAAKRCKEYYEFVTHANSS